MNYFYMNTYIMLNYKENKNFQTIPRDFTKNL